MPHAVDIVKGEIHRVMSVLRGNARYSSSARFIREVPETESSPLLSSLRSLYRRLQTQDDLYDVDAVAFTRPFLEVIQSEDTSGIITGIALSSINKFLLYGFIDSEAPCAAEAINEIARASTHCRFEPSSAADDEAVLMQLLEVIGNTLRSGAGPWLTDENIWGMAQCCFLISRVERGSHLLQRTGETALSHMVMHVFSRTHDIADAAADDAVAASTRSARGSTAHLPSLAADAASVPPLNLRTGAVVDVASPGRQQLVTAGLAAGHAHPLRPYGAPVLRQLLSWLASLADPRQHGRPTRLLGLELVNTVLETGGESLGRLPAVVEVIQGDLCKFLVANSRTQDLPTLSLALRVVFNLFASMKQHLKVQLEVFLTSVHLTLADARSASPEQRELALESLLEFCREPSMMLDLYVNFDCDVACANLFETLCRTLARCAVPDAGQPLTSLHTIAMDGLLSIVSSIAQRCPSHPSWQGSVVTTQQQQQQDIDGGGGAVPSSSAAAPQSPVAGTGALFQSPTTPDGHHHHHPVLSPEGGQVPYYNRSYSDGSMQASNAGDGGAGGAGTGRGSAGSLDWGAGGGPQLQSSLSREQTAAVLRQRRQLKRRMVMAASRFNGESKQWIEYGQELGLLPTPADAASVARFLRECPGLDKTLIGLYISEPDDAKHAFNTAVRAEYVKSFDFKGMPLDSALRVFLESFRLPGEAQKIERLMQVFSEHYYLQSPGPLHHADTAFVLAYSIIMLNTDLHNKTVRKKMTRDQFLSNNRKIDNGADLPPEYLTAIYNSILEKEIQLRADAPHVPAGTGSGGGSGAGAASTGPGAGRGDTPGGGSSSAHRPAGGAASTPAGGSGGHPGGDGEGLGHQWDGILRRQASVIAYQSAAGGSGRSGALALSPAGAHERDMFHLMVDPFLQAVISVFQCTKDAAVLKRAALGMRDIALLSAYYNMQGPLNHLVVALAGSVIRDMDIVSEVAEGDAGLLEYASGCVQAYLRGTTASSATGTTGTLHHYGSSDDGGVVGSKSSHDAGGAGSGVLEMPHIEPTAAASSSATAAPSLMTPVKQVGKRAHSESSRRHLGGGNSSVEAPTPYASSPSALGRTAMLTADRNQQHRGAAVNGHRASSSATPALDRRRHHQAAGHHHHQHHKHRHSAAAAAYDYDSGTDDNTDDQRHQAQHAGTSGAASAAQQANRASTDEPGNDGAHAGLLHDSARLGSSASSPGALLLRRMLLGLRSLLGIVSSHAESIREGWRNVVEVILRLAINDCLPPDFLDCDDFRAPNGMQLPSVATSHAGDTAGVGADESGAGVSSMQPLLASACNFRSYQQVASLSHDGRHHDHGDASSHPLKGDPVASIPLLLSGSNYLREAVERHKRAIAAATAAAATAAAAAAVTNGTAAGPTAAPAAAAASAQLGGQEPQRGGGGLWGTLTSLFGGFANASESNDKDTVAETVLTAVAAEVTRTRALTLLIAKSSVLPDQVLGHLLQALVTVRDPSALAAALGSDHAVHPDNPAAHRGMQASSDDSSAAVSAVVVLEILSSLAIRNIHRIHLVLPLLTYYYRHAMGLAAAEVGGSRQHKQQQHQALPSRSACYVAERATVNLLRVSLKAFAADETLIAAQRDAAAALQGPRYQFSPSSSSSAGEAGHNDGGDDEDHDHHNAGIDAATFARTSGMSADVIGTPVAPRPHVTIPSLSPTGSDGDGRMAPIAVVRACLESLSGLPEPTFALIAPRLSCGISLLLHIGPSLQHVCSLGSTDMDAVVAIGTAPDAESAGGLRPFFELVLGYLDRCHRFFFAAPAVWDVLTRLSTSGVTADVVTAAAAVPVADASHAGNDAQTAAAPDGIDEAAAARQSPLLPHVQQAAVTSLLRLHGDVFESCLRFLLRYSDPCLVEDAAAGCAAAVYLSELHDASSGGGAQAVGSAPTMGGLNGPGGAATSAAASGGGQGPPRRRLGSWRSERVGSDGGGGRGAHTMLVAALAPGGASSDDDRSHPGLLLPPSSSASSSSSPSEYETTLRSLVADQSTLELREFASQASLRLLEQLAASAPHLSPDLWRAIAHLSSPGRRQSSNFPPPVHQWLLALRALRSAVLSLQQSPAEAFAALSIVHSRGGNIDAAWLALTADDAEAAARGAAAGLPAGTSAPLPPLPAHLGAPPSPAEQAVWHRTSGTLQRLVLGTMQRLLLEQPASDHEAPVEHSRSSVNEADGDVPGVSVSSMWASVFKGVLLPLQRTSVAKALGLRTIHTADDDGGDEGGKVANAGSVAASATTSLAAALRMAVDADLATTSKHHSQGQQQSAVTLESAEAVVQVNGLAAKAVMQAARANIGPIAFTDLWSQALSNLLAQYKQAATALPAPAVASTGSASRTRPAGDDAAARSLLVEGLVDDVRKLVLVLASSGALAGDQPFPMDARLAFLRRTWSRVQADMPLLLPELRMALPAQPWPSATTATTAATPATVTAPAPGASSVQPVIHAAAAPAVAVVMAAAAQPPLQAMVLQPAPPAVLVHAVPPPPPQVLPTAVPLQAAPTATRHEQVVFMRPPTIQPLQQPSPADAPVSIPSAAQTATTHLPVTVAAPRPAAEEDAHAAATDNETDSDAAAAVVGDVVREMVENVQHHVANDRPAPTPQHWDVGEAGSISHAAVAALIDATAIPVSNGAAADATAALPSLQQALDLAGVPSTEAQQQQQQPEAALVQQVSSPHSDAMPAPATDAAVVAPAAAAPAPTPAPPASGSFFSSLFRAIVGDTEELEEHDQVDGGQ